MQIGIGLPNTIPDTEGPALVEWARRAEAAGFSALSTIGRLVYPNYDEIVALSAAAAVTQKIRLITAILIAPLHLNTALFAKQTASLDRLSGGRLVLGLALGGRDDDFTASSVETKDRGARFDRQLEELKRIWAGEERGTAGAIGPTPSRGGGPEILIGGQTEASYRRAARFGSGWIMGGGTPEMFGQGVAALNKTWQESGRTDIPWKASLAYFGLGPRGREHADRYLKHYYAFLGSFADRIAESAAVTPEMVRNYVQAFTDVGCDELLFVPTSSDAEQVDLLADAVK